VAEQTAWKRAATKSGAKEAERFHVTTDEGSSQDEVTSDLNVFRLSNPALESRVFCLLTQKLGAIDTERRNQYYSGLMNPS
jgi:hypothetical protein